VEYLIAIMHGERVVAAVAGDWDNPSSWTLKKVRLWGPYLGPYLKEFEAAIFENSYGVAIVGGITPKSVEHYWEGVKQAVFAFCRDKGFEWRFYVEDPEYTAQPEEGSVQ